MCPEIALIQGGYVFGSLPLLPLIARREGIDPRGDDDLHIRLWRRAGRGVGSAAILGDFATREEFSLLKSGDELVVKIGNRRRNIVLPQVLLGLEPSEAKLDEGRFPPPLPRAKPFQKEDRYMSQRVVVTGLGTVNPLGLDVASTWQSLVAGKSGVDFITLCDVEDLSVKIAGEVKGFDPTQYVDRKSARRMDRFAQFAVAASLEAVEHASLKLDPANSDDIGVLIGSGMGGLITISDQIRVLRQEGPDRVSPFLVPMMIIDIASGQVAMALGARGPNYGVVSACASGAHAIGEAFWVIRQDKANAMIAGGNDATVTPIAIAGFAAMGALSRSYSEPSRVSRPFDADRDGFVMSEGAAVLVLENLDFALDRGAPILAEVVGYGATGDAYHICEMPDDGEGAARAMGAALLQAGLEPEQIDYINAHGTSTRLNDRSETIAIKSVFGEHAYKVPISSTKSMMGHLMGAAGAIEALISVLTIRSGIIPPTINLERPDPECDLDYVPNVARQRKVKAVLSNSFGFGGHNVALIFKSAADL